MKLRDSRLWISLGSLAIVLLLVSRDLERTSPGPLSPTHAQSSELNAPEGCAACHGDGDGGMAPACGVCHVEIDLQLQAGSGLHGAWESSLALDCGRCHVEHHGAQVPLVGDLAFEQAGLEEASAFEHGHTSFELTGRHDELSCADCHANAEVDVLAEGSRRFLGLSQECARCHEDPHEGVFARGCATCHGQEHPFADVASFVHGDAFPLVGAHATPSCSECHAPGTEHSVESLAGWGQPPAGRTCAECHDSPHSQAFLAGAGAIAQVSAGASCAQCHDARHASFAQGATMTVEAHAASGFALEEPHGNLACDACHGDSRSPASFAERFPERSAQACESCHEDPHAGDFQAGPFAGEGCASCHLERAFRPHAFDAGMHARTAFVRDGAHAAVECSGCHERVEPDRPRRFDGAPLRCDACHEDAHEGRLTPRVEGEDCSACHTTTLFAEVDREAFEHDLCTRFELDGAHARASCEACHTPTASADSFGRTFGRVEALFGPRFERCETCHQDVHRGAFRGREHPRRVSGRIGCARCHSTGSFRSLLDGSFAHGEWTGFVLEGAHDAIACQSCHAESPGPGRSLGFAQPGDPGKCRSCHEDYHLGAFDPPVAGRTDSEPTDCAQCHGIEAFDRGARDRFDHGRWTSFPLTGGHAEVSCDDCHVVRAEGRASLGAVLGKRCGDCHGDPHVGQFAEGGRTDCQRCHSADDLFSEVTFDHQRDSRFPLDEQHRDLACAACHRPWPLPNGGEAVRYKPLGTRCIECHATGTGERPR